MNKINTKLTRRSFMSLSLACSATGALASPSTVMQALLAEDGFEKITKIITETYGPSAAQKSAMRDFYLSLQKESKRHERFQQTLDAHKLSDELKRFVVEEFAVRTNILAFHSGLESTLVVIPS